MDREVWERPQWITTGEETGNARLSRRWGLKQACAAEMGTSLQRRGLDGVYHRSRLYAAQLGFQIDYDITRADAPRAVQLTLPGYVCTITLDVG